MAQRVGLLGKLVVLATSIGATAGGAGFYAGNKIAEKKNNQNLARVEKKVKDLGSDYSAQLESERAYTRSLAEAHQKSSDEASNLNTKVEELQATTSQLTAQLEKTQKANNDMSDLSDRVNELEGVNKDLTTKLSSVSKTTGSIVGLDKVSEIIARSAPSAFMISAGDKDQYKWSGFFIKDNNGKRYAVTCGHSFSDVIDFLEGKLNINGYNGLYNFKIVPPPLNDGSIAFLPLSKGDVAIFPLTESNNEMLNNVEEEHNIKIGLKIRDITNMPKPGEMLFNVGFPLGLDNSVGIKFVVNASRTPSINRGPKQHQLQITPGTNKGDSGSPLIDLNGEVCGMCTLVMTGPEVQTSMGFGVSNRHLKQKIEELFQVPVMNQAEKDLRKVEKIGEDFLFPTPQSPLPIGYLVPKKQHELPNVKVVKPVSRFIMPTPSPFGGFQPIINYLSAKKS